MDERAGEGTGPVTGGEGSVTGGTESGGGHGAEAPSGPGGTGAPEPTRTLLVLGASGDLATRLLLPGLGELLASSRAPQPEGGLRLVGAGVEDLGGAEWRERVARAFADATDAAEGTGDRSGGGRYGSGADQLEAVLDGTRYRRTDVTDDADLTALLATCTTPVAVYFALPPAVTAAACAALERTGVPDGTRLVMEKPFGVDEASAHRLNALVARIVPEHHVHRVDHFLGRSTALNVLGVRFANRIVEPVLTAEHVERVDVVYDEDLALEGRAGYYDRAGALVDMVQSHLLLVLALLAMDPPSSLAERELRDRQAELLRATRLAGPPAAASRRAVYTAGRAGGRAVPDYTAEDGVDAARGTETLAEVVLAVDTWRWAGVPFRLRSGKALGRPRKEAVVTFKPVPHLPGGFGGTASPSRLRLGFSPDAVTLELAVSSPGDPFTLDATRLSSQMGAIDLPAYGQVLAGVLSGDPTLSVRGDVAETCWRIVEPVLAAWRDGGVPLETYAAGSAGPPARDGFPEV